MKKRLDLLMLELGLADSRTRAQALIMAGQVSAEGRRLEKPGAMIDVATPLHLKDQPRYASRAGEKLASVAEPLGLDFSGKTLLDVGSSTGGFTDYALQHGAERVYCVDVGTSQLAYKLRQDERVIVMEQTDIRDVTVGQGFKAMPEAVDMAVMDVSFISMTKVLLPTAALIKSGGPIVAMAKPQFEAGKPVADKYHGVIPMGEVRDEILGRLELWFDENEFTVLGQADSGLPGAEGNVEHFYLLKYR